MDRLAAMHLFVRVAELGSFAAVAQQLGVARSVVTRQVAALEAHLAVKLMARSTRRLSLTSAGTAYLEKCRVILNLVESAETDVAAERSAPRGNIRVSLPLSFGLKRLAPLLLEFSQRYPEVGLDMDYTDRRVKLIEEGIDLSMRITRKLDGGDIARRIGSGLSPTKSGWKAIQEANPAEAKRSGLIEGADNDPIKLLREGRVFYRDTPKQQTLEDWNDFWSDYKSA